MSKDTNEDFRWVLCVDFDGVIHAYSKGWHDGTIYDLPVPGVKESLEILKKKYRIVIYTARSHDRIFKNHAEPNQLIELAAWLKKYEIPYDEIYTGEGKPVAVAYIDDRAIRFNGDWNETLIEASTFKSWTEQPTEENKPIELFLATAGITTNQLF